MELTEAAAEFFEEAIRLTIESAREDNSLFCIISSFYLRCISP